jgi:hypothetical protein
VPRVYLLLHNNRDLRNSTVVGRLSMFATYGRFPWRAPTNPLIFFKIIYIYRLMMVVKTKTYTDTNE